MDPTETVRELSPEEEALRNKQLELGWNNKISIDKESRRILTMSEDIRDFINASLTPKHTMTTGGGDDTMLDSPVGFGTTGNSLPMHNTSPHHKTLSKPKDAFETIASTFGFEHHSGTDKKMELKIIKCIVSRESLLMKLTHLCETKEEINPDGEQVLKAMAGSKILELLIQIRNITLDYLDNLHSWRRSAEDNKKGDNPKVFVWEAYNYTMKLITDLDFLADSETLVNALGLTVEKMRANPLMLPTTLEETAESWIDPALRASYDANNATSGSLYEERLRLRNAERMLLMEIECNGMLTKPQVHDSIGMGVSAPHSLSSNPQNQQNQQDYMLGLGKEKTNNMLNWQQEAQNQLQYTDPQTANYVAVNDLRPKSQASSRGNSRGGVGVMNQDKKSKNQSSPGNDNTNIPKHAAQQKKQNKIKGSKGWNAQAEIFPESENNSTQGDQGIESGMNFYENFEQIEEQSLPLSDMNQYDSYLTGNNVLDMDNNDGQYPDEFGFVNNNTGNTDDGRQFIGFGEDDLSSKVSLSSTLTIETLSAYDLELIIGITNPPQSVMLAGAACLIFLSDIREGENMEDNITWDAFRELVMSGNPAQTMNSIDPRSIAKFKVRAIQPFLDKIGFIQDGVPTDVGVSDGLGSGSGTLGLEVPVEAVESTERVFRWIHQLVHATDNSKKRKGAKVTLPSINGGGGEVGGEDKKKSKSVLSQQARATALMNGNSVARSGPVKRSDKTQKKGNKGINKLWPLHTEILENVYKHPLLLTVLSSQQDLNGGDNNRASKMKKEMLQYDPLEIAGNGADAPPEQIVVKVYNLVDSKEAIVNINMRDFTIFLYDLIEKYDTQAVADYFRPASLLWWVENLRNVIHVGRKANNNLILIISKAQISRLVQVGLGLISPEEAQLKNKPMSTGNNGNKVYHEQSQENSLESAPMAGISQPDTLPANSIELQQNGGGAGDWGFYEDEYDEVLAFEGGNRNDSRNDNRGDSVPSHSHNSHNKKPSRQEMRELFDQQLNQNQDQDQDQGEKIHEDSRGGNSNSKRNSSSGNRKNKQTPISIDLIENQPQTNSNPVSRQEDSRDIRDNRDNRDNSSRQREMSDAIFAQQTAQEQQQQLPLDYGEDVFEDDGDGEFEEEVARATQLRLSMSREKPLSAPGSLSAPQSMSSVRDGD